MKRSRLAALLGACVVSATLALTPATASAWWKGQPLEKQVVTEGDPDDPDLTYPDDDALPMGSEEGTDLVDTAALILMTVLDAAGF